MRAPAFWWRNAGLAAAALTPVAAVYGAVAGMRMRQAGRRAGVPVVCIGNPTLGGAGKTPTAIVAARLLERAGLRPAFLTRGYGGAQAGPLAVEPSRHGAADVGDEPLLLARTHPTIVARDRVAGAALAAANGADVIVMDDGFQNPSLAKDCAVLVVDSARGLGNGRVFPAGPLRAPADAQFDRADALVVIGTGNAAGPAVDAAAARRIPVFWGSLQPSAASAAALRGKPLLAFAGIGDPEKFFATLSAAGMDVRGRIPFADHHPYTADDAARLLRTADAGRLMLVTTEKDFVRLEDEGPAGMLRTRALVLAVELVLENEGRFAEFMLERIRSPA